MKKPYWKIDEQRPFVAVGIAVMTVSDSRTPATDKSGDTLCERLQAAGHRLVARTITPDEQTLIEAQLNAWIADEAIEVILTTGGTGVTGRDVTPEAVEAVIEKQIPGFGELFRMLSYQTIGTSTVQSRATAGVANGTYIFSLPGSPGACRDAWDDILVYQLDFRHLPCNFVELLPRLRETEPTR
jgi:molybdopterin adenylyltransferase